MLFHGSNRSAQLHHICLFRAGHNLPDTRNYIPVKHAMIKKIIRLLVPESMRNLRTTAIAFWDDIRRYARFSNTYSKFENQQKAEGFLTLLYHVVEKGLTMPDTRIGFGEQVVKDLIGLCKLYLAKQYDTKSLAFTHSVKVLRAYLDYHEANNYPVAREIADDINNLSSGSAIRDVARQWEVTKNDFYSEINSSFERFCQSRHTVRHFTSEDIPLETLHACIRLANNSPSACNRQPNRVYIVKNREIIGKILELQNGNRGFGYLSNALLVVTSDISVFQSNEERREPMLNAGLYTMTLAYALHFHKIGSCMLNWSVPRESDMKIRQLIGIPDNEVVAVLIACGMVPDKFKVALSPKLGDRDVTHEIL
jgi:nitroreductase